MNVKVNFMAKKLNLEFFFIKFHSRKLFDHELWHLFLLLITLKALNSLFFMEYHPKYNSSVKLSMREK
jgi:hypothetical protein